MATNGGAHKFNKNENNWLHEHFEQVDVIVSSHYPDSETDTRCAITSSESLSQVAPGPAGSVACRHLTLSVSYHEAAVIPESLSITHLVISLHRCIHSDNERQSSASITSSTAIEARIEIWLLSVGILPVAAPRAQVHPRLEAPTPLSVAEG